MSRPSREKTTTLLLLLPLFRQHHHQPPSVAFREGKAPNDDFQLVDHGESFTTMLEGPKPLHRPEETTCDWMLLFLTAGHETFASYIVANCLYSISKSQQFSSYPRSIDSIISGASILVLKSCSLPLSHCNYTNHTCPFMSICSRNKFHASRITHHVSSRDSSVGGKLILFFSVESYLLTKSYTPNHRQ